MRACELACKTERKVGSANCRSLGEDLIVIIICRFYCSLEEDWPNRQLNRLNRGVVVISDRLKRGVVVITENRNQEGNCSEQPSQVRNIKFCLRV